MPLSSPPPDPSKSTSQSTSEPASSPLSQLTFDEVRAAMADFASSYLPVDRQFAMQCALRRVYQRTLSPVLACLFALLIVMVGGVGYFLMLLLPLPSTELGGAWMFYASVVCQFVGYLLLIWGWMAWRYRAVAHSPRVSLSIKTRPLALLGVTRSARVLPLLRGGLLAVLALSAPLAVLWLLDAVTVTMNALSLDWWAVILLSLGVFLFQGGVEEVIMRGWLLPELVSRVGLGMGIVLSTLVFTLFHGLNPNISWAAFLNIFIAGLAFALMYIRWGSLWVAIGFHGVWNWAQASLYGFSVSGIAIPASVLHTQSISEQVLLTGGEFGLEGSVLTTASLLVLVAMIARFGVASEADKPR